MIRRGVKRFFHLALRRRDRWEREVEDEIKLHLALRAEQLAAEGRPLDEAYDEALRKFGPLTESRTRLVDAARHREVRMQRTEFFDDLIQDIRFALRTLRRQKAWTAVTILTLALGIGATTAVFSVVSTLLLHPLPYPNANRVVFVTQQPSGGNNTGISVHILTTPSVFRAWRNAHSFEAIEGSMSMDASLKTVSGAPSGVTTTAIEPTFLGFAGVQPMRGRMFTPTEIQSKAKLALLAESFWRERLGSDPAAIGRTITLDDQPFVVIGVLPAVLQVGGPGDTHTDVWLPLDLHDENVGVATIGRLRPGVTPETAGRELDSLYAHSAGFTSGKVPYTAIVATPQSRLRFHDSLLMLAGAVALVLLVACANVAHLLLAKAAARQRELAIRAALGAGRGRLTRQMLTECLLLTFTGTAFGLAVGGMGLRVLIALRPSSLDALAAAHLDATTFFVAVGAAMVSGILFATIGRARAMRGSTNETLKGGSLTASGSRRQRATRNLLVVSEMALSAALLVGSALLVRSVMHLQQTDLGFAPTGLYALRVPLDQAGIKGDDARAEFMRDFMDRVAKLPTVAAASIVNTTPGWRWFTMGRLEIEGEPRPPATSAAFIDVVQGQPDYFSTMRMTFREGTTFTDTTPSSRQVVVNASFARKHWGRAAVGRRLRIFANDTTPWLTVVGVADDARTSGALSESTAPVLYSPMVRISGEPSLLVRTSGGAGALAPVVGMLKQAGVKFPPPIESVEEVMSRAIAAPRFMMMLLTVFTLLALVLAAVGLYGVMAFTVAQDTRDIGIRLALGASRDRIARMVIARGAAMAGAGAVVGLALAAWGSRLLDSQLHGVARLDPVSFAIGGLVLGAAAAMACVIPTRRALAVDPMTAIRSE